MLVVFNCLDVGCSKVWERGEVCSFLLVDDIWGVG